MQIIIDVARYFDWVPAEDGYTPTEEEILRMDYKQSVGDTWLKKVVVENPTETYISIPESQIEVLMAHFERVGQGKSYNRVVADYIESTVMVGHAPSSCWKKITVDGDAELEAYLNNRFEIPQEVDSE